MKKLPIQIWEPKNVDEWTWIRKSALTAAEYKWYRAYAGENGGGSRATDGIGGRVLYPRCCTLTLHFERGPTRYYHLVPGQYNDISHSLPESLFLSQSLRVRLMILEAVSCIPAAAPSLSILNADLLDITTLYQFNYLFLSLNLSLSLFAADGTGGRVL